MHQKRSSAIVTTYSVIWCLLCSVLVAPAQDVPSTPPEPAQVQIIELLRVPELEAGCCMS